MTTRVAPDWKVSVARRILLRVGWAAIVVAIYFATAAAILDSVGVWWLTAGLAVGVMVLVAALPEPVPSDYLIEGHAFVDTHRVRPESDRIAA